jgi:hypothetical protein
MMTTETAAWLTKLMVEKGARTFGDLMVLLNTPPSESEETPPPLTWSFLITEEDVASDDPATVDMFTAQPLTNAARERMMREYALFSGRSFEYVEQQIISLRLPASVSGSKE